MKVNFSSVLRFSRFLLPGLLLTCLFAGPTTMVRAQEDPPEEIYYDYFGDFGISFDPESPAEWTTMKNSWYNSYIEAGFYNVNVVSGTAQNGSGTIQGSNTDVSVGAVVYLHNDTAYDYPSMTWIGGETEALTDILGYANFKVVGPQMSPYSNYAVDIELQAKDGSQIQAMSDGLTMSGYAEAQTTPYWGVDSFKSASGGSSDGAFTGAWNQEDNRRTVTISLFYSATDGLMHGTLSVPVGATSRVKASTDATPWASTQGTAVTVSGVVIKDITLH
jgi:hypothetical protein